ncbi:MAG: MAPEG family protein [Hyphomicrobiaceae bacterium]|nr:MAPEG family protein [Hyphomicrobiaceae bacterium]
MSSHALFWPAFAQVLLTFVVMVAMGRRRAQSLARRKLNLDDVAMNRSDDWDEEATKAANNYKNQFEIPVLFFAGVAVALALKQSDAVLVGLAWVFVLARVAHAVVHLTFNKVMARGTVWLISVIAVMAMWIVMAVRVGAG